MPHNQRLESPRYMNPKHVSLMAHALERVYNKTFDELDIRALLIGIRTYSNQISKRMERLHQDIPQDLRDGFEYLADIAHGGAHPELRTKGALFESAISQISCEGANFYIPGVTEPDFGRLVLLGLIPVDFDGRDIHVAFPVVVTELDAWEWTTKSLYQTKMHGATSNIKLDFNTSIGLDGGFRLSRIDQAVPTS